MNTPKVYLIDASIYVFRSYFSTGTDYRAKDGSSINAVYGFARFLSQFIHQTKAQYIACAFDESLETSYRKEIFPEYKANREPPPDELKRQFKLCQQVAKVFGVTTYCDGYYEADDIIGTLSHHFSKNNYHNVIVSADKDLAQLIGANDLLWDFGKNQPQNTGQINDKFGVKPEQIADFLALTGDSVDNIKGVPGIGQKAAAKLLNHFNTLDQIFLRCNEIQFLSLRGAKSCQLKIQNNVNQALLAKKLTQIITTVPINHFNIKRQPINETRIYNLFDYLNFGPLLRKNILQIKNI